MYWNIVSCMKEFIYTQPYKVVYSLLGFPQFQIRVVKVHKSYFWKCSFQTHTTIKPLSHYKAYPHTITWLSIPAFSKECLQSLLEHQTYLYNRYTGAFISLSSLSNCRDVLLVISDLHGIRLPWYHWSSCRKCMFHELELSRIGRGVS